MARLSCMIMTRKASLEGNGTRFSSGWSFSLPFSLCVSIWHPLSYRPFLFWLKSSRAQCGPWVVDQAPPPPLCRLKTKRTFQGVEEMFWEQGKRDGWFPCRGGADSNRSFLSSHIVGFQCHVKPSRHLTLTSAHSRLIYLAWGAAVCLYTTHLTFLCFSLHI